MTSGIAHLEARWRLGGNFDAQGRRSQLKSAISDLPGGLKGKTSLTHHPDMTYGELSLRSEPAETGDIFPLLPASEALPFFMNKIERLTPILPDIFGMGLIVSFEQFEETAAAALQATLKLVGPVGIPASASDFVFQFSMPPFTLGIVQDVQLIRHVKWQQFLNRYTPPDNALVPRHKTQQWTSNIVMTVSMISAHMLYEHDAQMAIWSEIQDEMEMLLKNPTVANLGGG